MKQICVQVLGVAGLGLLFLLLTPQSTQAQTCPFLGVGDVFKVPDVSTVYLVSRNYERLYFPNNHVYHTWYDDFSEVVTIEPECVDEYPAPVSPPYSVSYREGSRLITTPLTSDVYAVLPNRELRKIGSEGVAAGLYGNNWASLVHDMPEVYMNDYDISELVIDEIVPHDGMMVQELGHTTAFLIENGERRAIEPEDIPTNVSPDIRLVPDTVLNAVPESTPIYEWEVLYDITEPVELPYEYEYIEYEEEESEDIDIGEYQYSRIHSSGGYFSVEVPTHWEIETGTGGADMFVSEETTESLLDFLVVGEEVSENEVAGVFYFVLEDTGEINELAEFFEQAQNPDPEAAENLEMLRELGFEIEFSDITATRIGNNYARGIEFNISLEGEEGFISMVLIETEKDGNLYYAMYMAVAEGNQDKLDAIFEHIHDSFQFEN